MKDFSEFLMLTKIYLFCAVYSQIENISVKNQGVSMQIKVDHPIDREILPNYMSKDSCPLYFNISLERLGNSSERQVKEFQSSPGVMQIYLSL